MWLIFWLWTAWYLFSGLSIGHILTVLAVAMMIKFIQAIQAAEDPHYDEYSTDREWPDDIGDSSDD